MGDEEQCSWLPTIWTINRANSETKWTARNEGKKLSKEDFTSTLYDEVSGNLGYWKGTPSRSI